MGNVRSYLKVLEIIAILLLAIWGIFLFLKGNALCIAIIGGSFAFASPLIKNRTIRILFYVAGTLLILFLAWMAIKGYLSYR